MDTLDNILETLIINGSLNEHPGLFYGKTGIALFSFIMPDKPVMNCFRNMLLT